MAATIKSQAGSNNPQFIHGLSHANCPTYNTWVQMRRRCRERRGYVDRQISVCDRWNIFLNFLEDMGHKPEGTQLDRIDNDLGYYKDNCRWATPKMNSNNRRSNHRITYNGITKTASEWSDETGIDKQTIAWRSRKGWPVERILER